MLVSYAFNTRGLGSKAYDRCFLLSRDSEMKLPAYHAPAKDSKTGVPSIWEHKVVVSFINRLGDQNSKIKSAKKTEIKMEQTSYSCERLDFHP